MRPSLLRLALALALCLAASAPAPAQNSVRGPSQPVPMKIVDKEEGAKAAAPQPKFPNKDTAVNRQDYDMGTEHGQDALSIGRDEATGENVMRHSPPRKVQQQKNEFDGQPIEVKPQVRMPARPGDPVWK